MSIRVLIADDQPLVSSGIAMLLEADPDIVVVAVANNGEEAVEMAASTLPDVLVVDVRMPGIDGIETTRRIGELAEQTGHALPVLILTTYNLDEAVFAALRAGASGFLLKDAVPRELIVAIKALNRGEGWLDPAVTRSLINEFAARPESSLPQSSALALLTPREREVLTLAALSMSNAEIAHHLVVGESTVQTHVKRVLMKLGLHDRAAAVACAYQTGLVVPGQSIAPLSPN